MNGSFDPRDPLEAMTAAWAKPGEPREPPTTNGAASWTEPDNKPIKVHDAGDLYSLTLDDIASLERMAKKSASNE